MSFFSFNSLKIFSFISESVLMKKLDEMIVKRIKTMTDMSGSFTKISSTTITTETTTQLFSTNVVASTLPLTTVAGPVSNEDKAAGAKR